MSDALEEPLLARAPLPLAAGVVAGGVAGANADATLLALVLAAAATIVLAAAATMARGRRVLGTAVAAFGIGLGGFAAVSAGRAAIPLPADHVARLIGPGPTAVVGTVTATEQLGDAVRLVVAAERASTARRDGPACGLVGLTIAHPAGRWESGSRVRVVTRLRRPTNFGNPAGYDYERALARRAIYVTGFLWDDRPLTLVAVPPPGLWTTLATWRARVAVHIAAAAREPARGFLAAVLIGAAGAVGPETQQHLARTGLSHVTSVSGFHLAVVGGAAMLAIGWLLRRSERALLHWHTAKIAALAGVVPVLAYGAIAGGSVPASRSLAMYAALLAALLADRPADGLRALAAAALVLALAVPDVGADIAFELSFVSVAALLVTAVPARRGGERGGRQPRAAAPAAPARARWWRRAVTWALTAARAPLRVSVAAALATAPLTAWHFQQVSLIAPIANLLALPLLGPATLLPGLLALPLLAIAPAAGDTLLRIAAVAATAGLDVAGILAALPGAAVATPMPNGLEVALAYGFLALPLLPGGRSADAVAGALRAGAADRATLPAPARNAGSGRGPAARRLVVAVLVAASAADVGYWVWERTVNPELRVTFLSVGQGDAAVVELPGGGVLVVDGGGLAGAFDTGERLVAPFLRARKILRIDALVLSHPQLDHYGGLAYLAEHFRPREFWSNGTLAEAPGFARLQRALERAGTRRVVLARGATMQHGNTMIAIVHPPPAPAAAVAADDLNNGSLVLRITLGAASVLFTGDIEGPAELAVIAAGVPIASTVLKVPHHGSRTSSSPAFLRAVAPRVAVISAGAENRFGFPAPAVVERLRAADVGVWRTDRDGAVRIATDGARLTISAPRRPFAQVIDLKSPDPFGSSARF